MATSPVEGKQYNTKYGTSRSGVPFRKVSDTAQVTWGVVRKNEFEGEYVPHETQSREEQKKNWVEKEEETRGLRWNVFDTLSANGVKLVRTDSNEQLEIALKNATLNKQANQLTVCGMMGKCVVYALTAAGAALVAAKLAGLAGGKKSRTKRRNKSKRNKSKRNKSKRNKSKHNKSKKNKRRSIRRR
jgi:hypothetical protein